MAEDGRYLLEDDAEDLAYSINWRCSNVDGLTSTRYFRNFVFFTFFFVSIHAMVDTVLAFSTAELGMDLGSSGNFLINLFYTLSAFFLAKPFLSRYGGKNTVAIGLLGMLTYVFSFFVAIAVGSSSPPEQRFGSIVFQLGAALGGMGAGLLWTGQGSYFTTNAVEYAHARHREIHAGMSVSQPAIRREKIDAVIAKFAGIFAFAYLLMETLMKSTVTFVYLSKEGSQNTWKRTVFGLYSFLAVVAWLCFVSFVVNFKTTARLSGINTTEIAAGSADARGLGDSGASAAAPVARPAEDKDTLDPKSSGAGENSKVQCSTGAHGDSSKHSDSIIQMIDVDLLDTYAGGCSSRAEQRDSGRLPTSTRVDDQSEEDLFTAITSQYTSVAKAVYTCKKLQFLLPYQIMFGFGVGFVNAFMNADYVSRFLGDGYIGILSAIITVTAAVSSFAYAKLAIQYQYGAYWVMLFGGFAFLYCGLSVMVTSSGTIGTWNFLGVFYWIFGFGRGAWESTNKAVVASYFKLDPALKDAAFAAVYFSSGMAAAIAYATFRFMDKSQIVTVCVFAPVIAILCFHVSYETHICEDDEKRLRTEAEAGTRTEQET